MRVGGGGGCKGLGRNEGEGGWGGGGGEGVWTLEMLSIDGHPRAHKRCPNTYIRLPFRHVLSLCPDS